MGGLPQVVDLKPAAATEVITYPDLHFKTCAYLFAFAGRCYSSTSIPSYGNGTACVLKFMYAAFMTIKPLSLPIFLINLELIEQFIHVGKHVLPGNPG